MSLLSHFWFSSLRMDWDNRWKMVCVLGPLPPPRRPGRSSWSRLVPILAVVATWETNLLMKSLSVCVCVPLCNSEFQKTRWIFIKKKNVRVVRSWADFWLPEEVHSYRQASVTGTQVWACLVSLAHGNRTLSFLELLSAPANDKLCDHLWIIQFLRVPWFPRLKFNVWLSRVDATRTYEHYCQSEGSGQGKGKTLWMFSIWGKKILL